MEHKDVRLRVFLNLMDLIEKTHSDNRLAEVGKLIFEDFSGISKFHNGQVNLLIDLLTKSLFPNDTDFSRDWIEWWLFESGGTDRKVSFKGEEIHEITLIELGEYLIENYSS